MSNKQEKDYTSRILIVDDDPFARESIEALLFKEGYQLLFAEDGNQALQKAAEIIPDLILLDVMLPDMDGFEVCKKIRNDPVLFEIPIIFITALDDRESLHEGIRAGADDFLSKPYDRTELRLRVKTITRLDRYRHLLKERKKTEEQKKVLVDRIDIICNTLNDKIQDLNTKNLEERKMELLQYISGNNNEIKDIIQ
jgi:DNA-binding response OmpR family regulator